MTEVITMLFFIFIVYSNSWVMSPLKNLSKDTLTYGVDAVIQKIIAFIMLPFYTRTLILTEYGVLDTLATFMYFVSTIFGLGIVRAASQYFFIADSNEEKKKLLYTSALIELVSYPLPLVLRVHLSSLILHSQTDRQTALAELQKPLCDKKELQEHLVYVPKKLSLSREVFDKIVNTHPQKYEEFLPSFPKKFSNCKANCFSFLSI